MNVQELDLKKTVNLPKTDFPMKANLPQLEPKLLAHWEESSLYERQRSARAGQPLYVLHDGPPYANGNIHLGHAFNKLLKDFILKSKGMSGFDTPYIPGWDCHGLPIEIKVDSELGSKKASMTTAQIRAACRRYAQKFVDLQSKDFQRLGILGRWNKPYLTMSAQYEAVIARAFVQFLESGYIYKGLKPVNWCPNDRTALAEAEVEYEQHRSPSIYVRFALESDPSTISPALTGQRVYALIWTTTPWTIPANMAISYNPRFTYVAVSVGNDIYIVAEGLLAETAARCNWESYNVVASFEGQQLEGAVFKHPFLERTSPALLGDHVTLEQGTGAVHTAPGHGQEDYVICQRYGIPTYCPVDAQGRFFQAEGAPGALPDELLGRTIWEGNKLVIDLLRHYEALLAVHEIEHSYPHCWRCHKPTIYRATEQWFIGMDRNDLRTNAIEAIKRVQWMPAWGEERITNMIATRPDWCISRQRVWGVPITVFYCEACNEPLIDPAVLHRVVDQFEQHTSDVWYERTAEELLGPSVHCHACGNTAFRKESDILDVWFDSGASHLAVLNESEGLPWPAQMYLEGGDQYRGWFHSSLLIGVGLKGGSPYEACATNGWTLDGEGRAMSKSLGNTIEPEKIIKQYGAELLRLWVASVEYYEDVRLSDTILTRLTEAYRKLRNTFRYALGNLHDFDPLTDAVPVERLPEIDQWILVRTEGLVQRCQAWFDELQFHKVYQALYNFATTDLSSIYFDVLKDRLYTTAPRSEARRSAQTALYRVTYALVRLMAPILAFTTEEVWGYLRKPTSAPDSVHLSRFPAPEELTEGLSEEHRLRAESWDQLLSVRDVVLKSLETARQEKFIGAPLEAHVALQATEEMLPLLQRYKAELPSLFIVSQVSLGNHHGGAEPVAVEVRRAEGVKCERCWKYKPDVGADPELPTICLSCAEAVREIAQD